MASQSSDLRSIVAQLGEAARRGDWPVAGKLAAMLRKQAPPETQHELSEYLVSLKEALNFAKASRAHMASSLVKLRAAAGFHRANTFIAGTRQNFADPADFGRAQGMRPESSQ